jgi:hypothetical protein
MMCCKFGQPALNAAKAMHKNARTRATSKDDVLQTLVARTQCPESLDGRLVSHLMGDWSLS